SRVRRRTQSSPASPNGRSSSFKREVIELRLGVRLRPESKLSGTGEGLVRALEELLPVVVAGHLVAAHRDAERVPAVRVGDVRVLNERPLAVDDLVEPVVVLERVVAGE